MIIATRSPIVPFCFFKIQFNNIHPRLGLLSCFSFRFSHQNLVRSSVLLLAWCMLQTSYYLPFHQPNNMSRGVQIMKLLVMHFPASLTFPSLVKRKCNLHIIEIVFRSIAHSRVISKVWILMDSLFSECLTGDYSPVILKHFLLTTHWQHLLKCRRLANTRCGE
jgi:hypothetical protein